MFILSCKRSQSIIAKFHCAPGDDYTWHSPPKAPFGGIEIEKKCKEADLMFLLNCIKEWFTQTKCTRFLIKTAPSCYQPRQQNMLHRCYINTGFSPVRTLVNHFILTGTLNFCELLHPSERRRLSKSAHAGFQAGLNRTISPATVTEFLLQSHHNNGYQLSLPKSDLEFLLTRFPNEFMVFTVLNKENLISLAVTVRVNSTILYYFTSAFLSEYQTYSPTVFLMACIYGFCQENGFALLDLGTSLDHEGNFKSSLANFKERIGGNVCTKVTYGLTLPDQIPRQLPSR